MKWKKTHVNQRRFIPFVLSLLLILTFFSGPQYRLIAAESSRVAVIESLSGSVTISVGGGAREVQGYEGMWLHQGDHLRTGSDAHAVLNIVDQGDRLTISSNATLYISDLSDHEGKQTKLKSWAGSVNLVVTSLLESGDVFEVDTPTSDFSVRGTHFSFYVDPVTGDTNLFVHSGVVRDRTDDDSAGESNDTDIFGGFGSYFPDNRNGDFPSSPVFPIDPNDIASITDEAIIRALLENQNRIQQENETMLGQLREHLIEQGFIDEDSGGTIPDGDFRNWQNNLDHLISQIIRQAVESQPDLSDVVDQFNRANQDRRLDLDNIPPFEGLNSDRANQERERLEQMRQQREQQLEEQRRQREEREDQNRELLDQINERNQQLKEQNQRIEEEQRNRAEERYLAALGQAEREQFKEELERREQSRQETERPNRLTPPTEPEPEPELEPEANPEPERESEPEPERDPEPEQESEPEAERDPDPDPDPEPEPERESDPEPEPEPDPDPDIDPDPEPEPDPDVDPDPEPEPEPEPEPVIDIVESPKVNLAYGETYSLPTMIEAVYDDGSTKAVTVTWLDELDLTKVGTQIIRGRVEGFDRDVLLSVDIEAPPAPEIEQVELLMVDLSYGEDYILPSTLVASYDDGTSKAVSVTWLDELDLTRVGKQTIRGKVTDFDGNVSLTVDIEAPPEPVIEVIEPTTVTAIFGESYSLPATVDAVYDDGTTKSVAVRWQDELDLTRTGTQTLSGLVDDYEGGVLLTVHIEAPLDTYVDVIVEDGRLLEMRFAGGVVLDLGMSEWIPEEFQIKVSKAAYESREDMKRISTIYEIVLGENDQEYYGEFYSREGIELSIPIDPSKEPDSFDDAGLFLETYNDWECYQTNFSKGIATARFSYLYPYNTFGVFTVEPISTPVFEVVGYSPSQSIFVDYDTRPMISVESDNVDIRWLDLGYPSLLHIYNPVNKPILYFRPGGVTFQAYAERFGRTGDVVSQTYHVVEAETYSIVKDEPLRFDLHFTEEVIYTLEEAKEHSPVKVNYLGEDYYMRVVKVADDGDEGDTMVDIFDVSAPEAGVLQIELVDEEFGGQFQVEFYTDPFFTQYQAKSNLFHFSELDPD